jgi:PleD family two-component response regulator
MSQVPLPHARSPIVLILTDSEWVSLSFVTLFTPNGYAVLRAFTGAQALRQVRETGVDIVIVDRGIKDMNAVEFCERMREEQGTPVVAIATGAWHREEKLAVLGGGAWDAVSLPLDTEEFLLRVNSWVRSKIAADAARERGLLDAGTGLYNAQGLLKRVAELGATAARHGRPLACLIVAAEFPESTGPARTTAPSVAVGAALRRLARASDAVGRLSATEFVVLAPETGAEGVRALAERVKEFLPEQPALRFGSFAVADFREAAIAPTELLLRAADALRAGSDTKDGFSMRTTAAAN